MVTIPAQVRSFIKRIQQQFAPAKIYVFGSRAIGKSRPDSDWDFIIISKKFEDIDGYHRAVQIHKLSKGDFALDVICMTPDEFKMKKQEPSLISEAINTKSLIEVAI